MIHPRLAVEGQLYGKAVISFKSQPDIQELPGPLYDAGVVSASSAKLSSIVGHLAAEFPQVSGSFDSNWQAWADSWLLPGKVTIQSSSAHAEGPEWDKLVKMGEKIIPAVVHQLSN